MDFVCVAIWTIRSAFLPSFFFLRCIFTSQAKAFRQDTKIPHIPLPNFVAQEPCITAIVFAFSFFGFFVLAFMAWLEVASRSKNFPRCNP